MIETVDQAKAEFQKQWSKLSLGAQKTLGFIARYVPSTGEHRAYMVGYFNALRDLKQIDAVSYDYWMDAIKDRPVQVYIQNALH